MPTLPCARSRHDAPEALHLASPLCALASTSCQPPTPTRCVMRPDTARNESSPAVLRLLVEGAAANTGTGQDALQVQVIKRRGPPLVQSLSLPARHAGLSALLAVSAARADSSGRYGASSPAPDSQEHTYALDCLASPA